MTKTQAIENDDEEKNNERKTLFISDLHIDSADDLITRSLLSVLEQHGHNTDAIYILGDLFEAWVGDDDTGNNAGNVVADALAALRRKGTRIYLMHGNRDFLIGPQYATRCGGELLDDPAVIDCYGNK